jgi:hypothetical protein
LPPTSWRSVARSAQQRAGESGNPSAQSACPTFPPAPPPSIVCSQAPRSGLLTPPPPPSPSCPRLRSTSQLINRPSAARCAKQRAGNPFG